MTHDIAATPLLSVWQGHPPSDAAVGGTSPCPGDFKGFKAFSCDVGTRCELGRVVWECRKRRKRKEGAGTTLNVAKVLEEGSSNWVNLPGRLLAGQEANNQAREGDGEKQPRVLVHPIRDGLGSDLAGEGSDKTKAARGAQEGTQMCGPSCKLPPSNSSGWHKRGRRKAQLQFLHGSSVNNGRGLEEVYTLVYALIYALVYTLIYALIYALIYVGFESPVGSGF
ncbi:hypothetical protein EDB83DRAFT_2309552 [Lactarius deliciosus]|nr:hypothetical protein EDB83DRAFT_2309552 [Lactarius deliciosus]